MFCLNHFWSVLKMCDYFKTKWHHRCYGLNLQGLPKSYVHWSQCSKVLTWHLWEVTRSWGLHLISGVSHWGIHNSVVLLGDGGHYRWLGLVGGSRALGTCPGRVYLVPDPFLALSLLLVVPRWAILLCHALVLACSALPQAQSHGANRP